MTIAANIATVPRLLGWDDARTAQRIDELLQLVGMDPASFRDRYPRELSGGQRQRIGVARALAADPPVLLMDEPFGAIDPINRTRVQDEFLKIQRQLRKTVVFVTHDIDEAIKMGDRIALLRDGRLRAARAAGGNARAPRERICRGFVGADRALKRFSLITCVSLASPGAVPGAPEVSADTLARDGLALMLGNGVRAINLAGGGGSCGSRTFSRARVESERSDTVGGGLRCRDARLPAGTRRSRRAATHGRGLAASPATADRGTGARCRPRRFALGTSRQRQR